MSRIDDGFPTLISFSAIASGASLKYWETEITPPGMDMGGENDTSNMRNTAWRTKAPKKLKTLTTFSGVCMYDPGLFKQFYDILGDNCQVTITFPDGSTLIFWGFLDKFTPAAVSEGSPPKANFTVVPTNQNGSGVEVAPTGTAMD